LRSAAANQLPFGLAIVDLRMPKMDGLALAREVKREPALAFTRLILLTAFDEKGLGEEALQTGFSAYLTKPIKQSHLYDTIVNILDANPLPTLQDPAPKREAELPMPQRLPSSMSHARILLAEDNPINQKVAMLQLGKLGLVAQTVANGREALEAVTRSPEAYQLVLMDCQMPEMDGFEAARAIRKAELKSGRHIPIIAMTANALEGDRERCIAVGMDDYISKPVALENLGKILRLWLPKEKGE
jgi:CheY-like chemotaxis protein